MSEDSILEQILHLSCRMAETRDLQPLLTYAVDVALDLFNAEQGYLVWRNPDGSLDFRVKRKRHGSEIAEPEISRQILDRVLSEGQPITAANALEDPNFDTSPSVRAFNLRSVMCVPLIAHDDIFGALYLDNRIEENAFTATDLKFLHLFANQAAVSIENAILNEDLEARIQARTAELDAYAGTVAHDLKNPLSTILGHAAYLADTWGMMSGDEIAASLKFIVAGSEKMSTIIDELLLLASVRKQTHLHLKPLNMAQIIADIRLRMAHLIRELHVEIQHLEVWPVAVGYAPWVEEVWINYISNAIKYGGTPPHIELGADVLDNAQVRFWVRDNGAGISPENLESLFAEFTRLDETRAQGHGLGLSIVKRIVERLGGQVGAESHMGEGSIFWFTLPTG